MREQPKGLVKAALWIAGEEALWLLKRTPWATIASTDEPACRKFKIIAASSNSGRLSQ